MAEVEDCLDFFICRLAEISDARKTVLLGRTPYSKKVEIAKVLSQIRTDDAISRHENVFTGNLQHIKTCRDVVAHGAYLGRTRSYEYAFLSQSSGGPQGEAIALRVFTFSTCRVRTDADALENDIPNIEQFLQIESLRETHRAPTLRPHPKARKKSSPPQRR